MTARNTRRSNNSQRHGDNHGDEANCNTNADMDSNWGPWDTHVTWPAAATSISSDTRHSHCKQPTVLWVRPPSPPTDTCSDLACREGCVQSPSPAANAATTSSLHDTRGGHDMTCTGRQTSRGSNNQQPHDTRGGHDMTCTGRQTSRGSY